MGVTGRDGPCHWRNRGDVSDHSFYIGSTSCGVLVSARLTHHLRCRVDPRRLVTLRGTLEVLTSKDKQWRRFTVLATPESLYPDLRCVSGNDCRPCGSSSRRGWQSDVSQSDVRFVLDVPSNLLGTRYRDLRKQKHTEIKESPTHWNF